MIKAIISDLGKVVVDYDHRKSTRLLSQKSALTEKEMYDFIYMSKMDTKFDTGRLTPKALYEHIRRSTGLKMPFAEFKRVFSDIFSLKKDTAELYASLKKKGLRFCLLSNTNVLHYEWCKKRFPFLSFFEHTVLSYKTGVMKPHPRIYMEAVKKLGLKKEECVYVDDFPELAEAAELLGLHAVHFRDAGQLKKELNRLLKR